LEKEVLCPDCGSEKIGKGRLEGHAALMPGNTIFSMGSEVVADVCTNRGLILRLKVAKPEKFKGTINK
jgi:hypothetical protein